MRSFKNNLLAGSKFLILLGSLIFSLPHATEGRHSDPPGHIGPVKTSNTTIKPAPLTGTAVAPATPGRSSVSRAAISEESGPPDILIDASLGDGEVLLEKRRRKGRDLRPRDFMVFKLKEVIVTGVTKPNSETPQGIDLTATIEGADAHRGSLPFILAWLAGDSDPLGSVRALGYDIEVRKEHERPCTDLLPSQTCVNLAHRLATLIDATLGFGSPEERTRFRHDASAIGIAPDCFPREP